MPRTLPLQRSGQKGPSKELRKKDLLKKGGPRKKGKTQERERKDKMASDKHLGPVNHH